MSKKEIKEMIAYHTSMMIFYHSRGMSEAYTEHHDKRHNLQAALNS